MQSVIHTTIATIMCNDMIILHKTNPVLLSPIILFAGIADTYANAIGANTNMGNPNIAHSHTLVQSTPNENP